MARFGTRLALAAVTSFACGVAPLAPLPAAQSAPGVWRVAMPASSAFDNLSAFPDGTGYASVGVLVAGLTNGLPAGVPGAGEPVGYLKSTDFAQTWTPMPAPPSRGWSGTANMYVRFATPTVGYATYSARMTPPQAPDGTVSRTACVQVSNTFRTTDGGRTWQALCEPQAARRGAVVFPQASPLAVARDGRTVLLTGTEDRFQEGCGPEQSVGVVHFSADGGASWTRGVLPRGYGPGWSVRIHDRRTALLVAYKYEYTTTEDECRAVGRQNAVFLTTDGGRTYRRVLTCAKQPLCTAVGFASRTRLFAGRTDGSTYVSRDGGRTWSPGRRLYDVANDEAARANPDRRWWHWVQSFAFPSERIGYASTRGAGTWRTPDAGSSWAQELSHECNFHPFGVGENAAFDADRALTGGPQFISVRTPAPAAPGGCRPDTGQDAAAPVALVNGVTVLPDGTLRRVAP